MTYRKLRKEFNDYFDSIKDSYLNKKIAVRVLNGKTWDGYPPQAVVFGARPAET